MSRSEASVSPFILRSAAAVCSSASEQTVALPTNNRPSPLPFVATRRVSSDPPHRAREIGDRRPLQDWPIGPCYCPFWPKDCQFGPQGPSIQAGMLKYKFAQMGAP